tara:strand:- start:812 stop:2107 length:1296 start_codon:yes stop_codon:yes gene_type:complete
MSWTNQLWNRPILKAKKKPVKKKRLVNFKGPDGTKVLIDQDVGEIHTKIKKDFVTWKAACKSLSLGAIGVVGKKANNSVGTPPNKEYFDTLLEHLENHVTSVASRTDQEKPLFKEQLANFERILTEDDDLIEDKEVKEIIDFTQDISSFYEGKTNPKNIPFKVPTGVSASEEGGFEADGWTKVYGHYRTPQYVEYQKKAKNKKGELKAVDDSWYGPEDGPQRPPMYQAMFSGSTKSEEKANIGSLELGILGILEKFVEEIKGAELDLVVIDFATGGGISNMEQKAEMLANFSLMRDHIKRLMKKPSTFSASGKVAYTGSPNALLDNTNNKVFNVSRKSSKFITTLGGLEEVVGHEKINKFQIRLTRPLLKLILDKVMREKGLFTAPNGKIWFTADDGGVKGVLRNWGDKIPDNLKPKKKEVKKSWVASLWS